MQAMMQKCWHTYRLLLLVLVVWVALGLFGVCTWGMGAAPIVTLAFVGGSVLLGFLYVLLATAVVTVIGIIRWSLLSASKLARRLDAVAERR
jgi:hypothetical protein